VAESFIEGTDYVKLEQPGPTDDASTIEVREFFWFGCPHCFTLEATIEKWHATKPEGATFVRTPPALNDSWAPHSHAFYVAVAMGKTEEVTTALFDAIHVKRETLRTEDDLARWFTRFGITEDEFRKMYNSFTVRTQVRKAKTLAGAYRLTGVPCIVVNGKYKVELQKAKSPARMMDIVNFLVAMERTASGK
jgi:thiol:disulfide interchange protein DsbA